MSWNRVISPIAVLVIAILLLFTPSQDALANCTTVRDCAQRSEEAALRAGAAVTALTVRINKLEGDIKALSDSLGGGRILAMAEVKASRLVYNSDGVSFDSGNGTITFPNPNNLKFVPVMSYISENGTYATQTVYAKTFTNNSVVVWQGALDTTGQNGPPRSFTLIVIGFK
jgi:hypothetical protein